MTRLAAHPLADLFPLIEGDDFGALVEDIRQHGVIDRIELLDGQILDGRNRYNALVHLVESGEMLGEGWGHRAGGALAPDALEPDNQWFRKFNRHVDGDPLPWVLSKNLKRRHLNEAQRASLAAKLETMRHGDNQHSGGDANLHLLPRKVAAELTHVSPRSVASAAKVRDQGALELQRALDQGKVAVSTAETIASLPQDEQAEVVARGPKEILAAAKEINAERRRARFNEVNQKLAAISEGSKPLPTGQRYPIIYADPATRYVSGFGNRSIENHYPTMPLIDICAMPVSDLATDDAMLQIWSTVPQLANTMTIIAAWGFKYVSCLCWDKVDQGTGHWAFNEHELLLIATRGNFPAPVPGIQPRSVHHEKKTDHSAKPAWFAEQIERMWPDLPKIELFCRSPRPGWASWGNQANVSDDSQAKASTGNGATEPDMQVPADGMSGDASRLTVQRMAGAAGDASASSAEDFDPDGIVVWKALGAIDADVRIEGSMIVDLVSRGWVAHSSRASGLRLTPDGMQHLGILDVKFNPEAYAFDDIPGEGASGTAREAPSAGSGDVDMQSTSGTQSAPPQPVDDGLDIPAFLRRRKDNSLPDLKAAS